MLKTMDWEFCLIMSHPNSCPEAKSQRIAETWCNSCDSPLWNFKLQFVNKVCIGISDHWPNSICNCCLFVPSPQWLHFIYTSRISKAAPRWAVKKSQCRNQKQGRKRRPGRFHNAWDISLSGGLNFFLPEAASPTSGTRGHVCGTRPVRRWAAADLRPAERGCCSAGDGAGRWVKCHGKDLVNR